MHEPGPLSAVKAELEAVGAANDEAVSDGRERMLNITPATGEFLGVLVQATGARRILEVGTSNGYSTLWLAEAARVTGGHVTTVEWATAEPAIVAQRPSSWISKAAGSARKAFRVCSLAKA